MPDQIFYVGTQDRNSRLNGYAPAKFLMRNGAYVADPTPGGSQGAYLYSDASGGNKAEGKSANPNNYLIVPANYSEAGANDFAKDIADRWGASLGDETGGLASLGQALAEMRSAFRQGGSQDLQRHAQWGVPRDSFVPAFKGAASYHVGYVTGRAGLPKLFVEVGGGDVNKRAAASMPPGTVDVSAPYGNSWHNYRNIGLGFANGSAKIEPPAAFADYGRDGQPQRRGGIGDGNGVSAFSAQGLDPNEPVPPAWPNQASAPIRYLSSYRVRY